MEKKQVAPRQGALGDRITLFFDVSGFQPVDTHTPHRFFENYGKPFP